jgi:hypothetical protein
MGLDIVYFTNVQALAPPGDVESVAEWANENQAIRYYVLDGMEGRLAGLDAEWVRGEFAGMFRAGSYSGYNQWRDLLARTVLGVGAGEIWASAHGLEGKPFVELIDFADNEGCLGPVVCAKLNTDFETHRNEFINGAGVDDYDVELYDKWAEAFAATAEGGIVGFF